MCTATLTHHQPMLDIMYFPIVLGSIALLITMIILLHDKPTLQFTSATLCHMTLISGVYLHVNYLIQKEILSKLASGFTHQCQVSNLGKHINFLSFIQCHYNPFQVHHLCTVVVTLT